MSVEKGIYARAHSKFIELMPLLRGRNFESKDVWDLIGLQNKPEHAPFKTAIAQVMYNLAQINKDSLLRQTGKQFRVIEKDVPEIEWWIPDGKKTLNIKWPQGRDGTSFGFEDSILIYPKDAIVVFGESNRGKTSFALNFLIENMDNYPCTYVSSEFNSLKFRDRMSGFDWVDVMRDDRPKFETLPIQQYYEDIVAARKNNIIIVDWVRMDDDAWKIRSTIDSIMQPLDNGICFIVLQKRTYKDWAEGGEGSKDLASVYLKITWQKLTVEKVKAPNLYDPNNMMFGFEISGGGNKFGNIRPVIDCPVCNGRKKVQGEKCSECDGIGHINK